MKLANLNKANRKNQCCGSVFLKSGSGFSISSESESNVFYDQKLKKYSRRLFYLFCSKNCYLQHLALQKIKFIIFFLLFCVIFAFLNQDPNQGTPIEFRSNPAPDPQHSKITKNRHSLSTKIESMDIFTFIPPQLVNNKKYTCYMRHTFLISVSLHTPFEID
jgi:hypothetical protein